MPRKNSTSWSVGNAVQAARLNALNADLDDLYVNGSDRLKIYQNTGDGLLVRIAAGIWRVWDIEWTYAGWTVTVTNTATNYIMINNTWTIIVNTTGYISSNTRLWRAIASGGTCTIIVDKTDAIGGPLSGKWIPDMRASAIGTPLSYASQSVTGPEFRPQMSINWAWYVGIPGMDGVVDWWTVITYWSYTVSAYTTQVAYSSNPFDGKDYIFVRHSTSNTVWLSWTKIWWTEQYKTAGEAITVSGTPIAVSKDTTGNIIYSNTSAYNRSNFYGFIRASVANGANQLVACNNGDIVGGFSGLTAGTAMYLSSTNGVISSTVWALYTRVWHAISTTEILIDKEIEVSRVTGTQSGYPSTIYTSAYAPTHDWMAMILSTSGNWASDNVSIQVNGVNVYSADLASAGAQTIYGPKIYWRASASVRGRQYATANYGATLTAIICKTFS